MFISSFHGIEESLNKGQGLKRLYVSRPEGPRVKKILEQARKLSLSVEVLDKRDLARLVPDQEVRGAVLELEGEGTRGMDMSQLLSSMEKAVASGKLPVLIALDGVTDPHNLGAIIRSADKLGAEAVLIPTRRSAGDGPVVQSASAGAAQYVPLVDVGNLVRALEDLKKLGFWVWGAEMGGDGIHTLDARVPLVVVMGNEGKGLSVLGTKTCDRLVSIPCTGHVDSLNVSNASAIILYEIWRQRNFAYQGKL